MVERAIADVSSRKRARDDAGSFRVLAKQESRSPVRLIINFQRRRTEFGG